MVARAIAESAPLHLGEAAQHDETLAERLERLHGRGELKARAFDSRRPLLHDHADRMEDKSQADWGFGGGGSGQRRNHGIEQGQRETGPEAAQDSAAR